MAIFLKPFFMSLLILSWLFYWPAGLLAATPSSQISLDSRIYSALDKLTGLGLIDSSLQGARPYTRIEAARQVQEAVLALERFSAPPVAQELIRLLENELTDSLAELRGEVYQGGYLKPVRQLDFRYSYQNGDPSFYPGTSAHQFPLSYNNSGLDYVDGSNVELRLLGEARIARLLQFDWEPLLLSNGDESFDINWLQARATLSLGAFELSLGRQSLWWGAGRHGSLVLSNNAKPLDMLRLANPSPILLPWIFKYLGPFHLDLFWSRLEKDRVVAEPYFAGMRVNIKPLPWVELGASRGVMFGGEGRPKIGWNDFITILGGKNLSGAKDTSNSVAAIDARVRLPFLAGMELYGEYGGEDEAGYFLAASAWMAGLYLPRVEPTGRLSLRLEFADLSKDDNLAPPWYHHGIYRSGYTYEGRILGHHVGGMAKDLFIETELLVNENLRLNLGVDLEKRGYDQPVQEEHQQVDLTVEWDMAEDYSISFTVGQDRVKNADYMSGQDCNDSLISISFQSRW